MVQSEYVALNCVHVNITCAPLKLDAYPAAHVIVKVELTTFG